MENKGKEKKYIEDGKKKVQEQKIKKLEKKHYTFEEKSKEENKRK